jgi:hypothetical protein
MLIRILTPNTIIIRIIKSRMMRWVEHGRIKNTCRILIINPEGNKSLARELGLKNNIKVYLKEIWYKNVNWIRMV